MSTALHLVPRADSTCLDPVQSRWMLNNAAQNPCQVAERIVQVCSPTAAVQHLSVDPSCSTLGVPGNSSCCCTTVSYALVAACWVCQTSRLPSDLTTTYETWLANCPSPILYGKIPLAVQNARPSISIPDWALAAPANIDNTWDISIAQRAANYTPTSITSSSIPSSTATSRLSASQSPSSTSANQPPPPPPRPPYTAIAITIAAILLFLLVMSAFLYRRHRQRHRVSSSTPPPPGFLIDDNLSPGLPDTMNQSGTWGWWKRWREGREEKEKEKERKRKTASDPGKIDAWRYPFDYTPVSAECGCAECLRARLGLGLVGGAGGSGSGSGGTSAGAGPSGGGYDPYPSGSRVTLLLPEEPRTGRRSTETLLPGSRTTPSPVLGQPQTYPHSYSYTHQNQLSPQSALSPHQHMGHLAVHQNGPATPPSYTSRHAYSHSQPHLGPDAPRTPVSHSPILPHQHQNQQPSPARQHAPTHTHTYVVRLTPEELVELPTNVRARIRPREGRRRHREREGGRSRDPGDRERRDTAGPSGGNRPRSLSVPVQINLPTTDTEPELEPDEQGGPRNGPELREKYRGRRNTDADTRGDYARGARVSPVRERVGGGGVVRAEGGTGTGRGGRAVDAGISLMGGPPRRMR